MQFIAATLIDGVRATLSAEEQFVLDGLTFDQLPSIGKAAPDDLGRQECGSLN